MDNIPSVARNLPENKDSNLKKISFGNTGFFILLDEKGISMHFLPKGPSYYDFANRENNSYFYIAALGELIEFLRNEPKYRNEIIRNSTNFFMNDFRMKVFQEFSKFSGVAGIYQARGFADNPQVLAEGGVTREEYLEMIGGVENDSYYYKIDVSKLLKAYEKVSQDEGLRKRMKFFKRLEKAKNEYRIDASPHYQTLIS
jgi:hypothetical protein